MGRHSSFAEASGAFARVGGTFEPDAGNAALYEDLFGRYREMRAASLGLAAP
jgi:hypothetical protein